MDYRILLSTESVPSAMVSIQQPHSLRNPPTSNVYILVIDQTETPSTHREKLETTSFKFVVNVHARKNMLAVNGTFNKGMSRAFFHSQDSPPAAPKLSQKCGRGTYYRSS
jgi:hypothetical protein